MSRVNKARILIAKPGLDGHDRGVRVVAKALRDEGYEVIYSGLRQTPETIAAIAVEEDVALIGLSVLSGSHLALTRQLLRELHKLGAPDTPVMVGGIVPTDDRSLLLELGVKAVLGPGASISSIVSAVEDSLQT